MYYVIVEPSINLVLFLIMKYLRAMLHLLSIMENMINRWHTWHYFFVLGKSETKCFFFHNHSNRFCVILHFIARYTSSTIYTRVDMYRQMKCYYLRSGIFHYFSSRLYRNVYFQAFYISESPLFYLPTIFPNGNILLRLLSSLLERSNNV